jgi:hypothetical protein
VDRLLDALAPERSLKGADRGPVPVEAHRTPNGCVLQGATRALTVSWFAEASDATTLGDLQITLWSGVVSRRGAAKPRENAVVVRELSLRPIVHPTDHNVWEAADGTVFDVASLAAYCLALLEGQAGAASGA